MGKIGDQLFIGLLVALLLDGALLALLYNLVDAVANGSNRLRTAGYNPAVQVSGSDIFQSFRTAAGIRRGECGEAEGISVGIKAAGEMLPDEGSIYPPPVLRKDIMKLQLFIEKISLRILSYIL